MYVCFILLLFFLVDLKLLEERHTTHTHTHTRNIHINTPTGIVYSFEKHTHRSRNNQNQTIFSLYIFFCRINSSVSVLVVVDCLFSYACMPILIPVAPLISASSVFFLRSTILSLLYTILLSASSVWCMPDTVKMHAFENIVTWTSLDSKTTQRRKVYIQKCVYLYEKKNTFIYGYIVSGWCRRLSEAFFFFGTNPGACSLKTMSSSRGGIKK